MNLSNLKLITFDATNTLIKFRLPPWQLYINVAKDHGFYGTEDDVRNKMLESYKLMCKTHPNYGKTSIGWEKWWSQLVQITLRDYLPASADLNAVANKLISEFKTARCWRIADGSVKLIDHFRKLNITVGIISNFDPRLYDILQSLKLDKSFDFIVTSYETGYSKPDKKIFKKALKMCKNRVKPLQALHIGDDIHNDYEGAKAAGWQAVIVNPNVIFETPLESQRVFNSLEDLYSSII